MIILTTYSDFEYAKRAIKYSGEYVLKISIIDELPLAVEKAIGNLSRLKKRRLKSRSIGRQKNRNHCLIRLNSIWKKIFAKRSRWMILQIPCI